MKKMVLLLLAIVVLLSTITSCSSSNENIESNRPIEKTILINLKKVNHQYLPSTIVPNLKQFCLAKRHQVKILLSSMMELMLSLKRAFTKTKNLPLHWTGQLQLQASLMLGAKRVDGLL